MASFARKDRKNFLPFIFLHFLCDIVKNLRSKAFVFINTTYLMASYYNAIYFMVELTRLELELELKLLLSKA